MTTRIRIPALCAATLLVVAAACGHRKDDGSGPPSFPEPPASPTQIDRAGRPGITMLIGKVLDTSGQTSGLFNAGHPKDDVATFGSGLTTVFSLLHGCPSTAVRGAILPDVLTFTTTSSADYARRNGRALADDAFDQTLRAIYVTSNGTPCAPLPYLTDHIDGNDVPFDATFPFLAPPH